VYLDTPILVKLVVREPDSDFYAALVDGQPAWSSQLVLVKGYLGHNMARRGTGGSQ